MSLGIEIALDALEIHDPQARETVKAGIPILKALVDHIHENKALFATLSADIQILIPAAKIVVDGMADLQRRFPS